MAFDFHSQRPSQRRMNDKAEVNMAMGLSHWDVRIPAWIGAETSHFETQCESLRVVHQAD